MAGIFGLPFASAAVSPHLQGYNFRQLFIVSDLSGPWMICLRRIGALKKIDDAQLLKVARLWSLQLRARKSLKV